MNNAYQSETDSFKKNFETFKNKKIVLYGIGRYTASLIPTISEFNIIGLMDRDTENIGKNIYGLPILSKKEVGQKADIIIINTSETYWEIIYSRISDLDIPIYFLNGQRAIQNNPKNNYRTNTYWNHTYDELVEKASSCDVISFDIFDTLIMWKVFLPQDIYKLIELEIRNKLALNIDFYRIRLETELNNRSKNITLDEIYQIMNRTWNYSLQLLEKIKSIEIQTTQKCVCPRKIMVDLCNRLAQSKTIFFISDMYLPQDILANILLKCGIKKVENLWISGELKIDKMSGDLWKEYKNHIGASKKILHIGDNLVSDIKRPNEYDIETYYIMSGSDMLKNSSIGNIVSDIKSLSESMYVGLLCTKLFNNPFALNKRKGVIIIDDYKSLGYCIFGGVICSFLLWIIEQSKEKKIDRFLFLARDGYFLNKDYIYIKKLLEKINIPKSCYFAISRRVVLIASYNSESDLDTLINFPYTGIFNEYMLDRFNIIIPRDDEHYFERVTLPLDNQKVKSWILHYKDSIVIKIEDEKKNYNKYLDTMELDCSDAVVDLWFYGNNQYYLSKILNMNIRGFYFAANKSPGNKCYDNNMFTCFQKEDDLNAEKCNLYKSSLWIESFLTAPHGMIKSIDTNGNYICAPKGQNQINFKKREYINHGICEFIRDYIYISGEMPIELNRMFIDEFFGGVINKNIQINDTIKDIFYYDNSMVKRAEYPIFE